MTKENYQYQDWEVVDKQRVVDKYIPPHFFTKGIVMCKFEYIIKNKKTGEMRRI